MSHAIARIVDRRMGWGLAAALVAGAATGSAHAQTLQARFDGVNPHRDIKVSTDAGVTFKNVRAGAYRWTRTGGTFLNGHNTFNTFCIELVEHIAGGNNVLYNIDFNPANGPTTGPIGAAKAAILEELFGRVYPTLDLSNRDRVVAMQLAVWEVVYDDGVDLAAGDFRAQDQGPWYGFAQTWLNSVDGTGPTLDLTVMLKDGKQDQILLPSPAAAGLLAMGGLMASRRRRA